ncbi:lysophospholipid acyltransferase family protein [candidate division KSB1 bacterium]|nr:lysophospholipid acyltransferase family protein [candidate division KSB1 bacterium]
MRRLKHWLEYQGVLFLLFLAQTLPLTVVLFLGRMLGQFTFSILRIRRRVALENLAQAFPEKTAAELKQIARRSYENFGTMMLEYLRLPRLSATELRQRIRFAMPQEQNPYEQALSLGKGAICMTGHFGNWEYMGALVASMQYPMIYLYQEQNNPYVDALIRDTRTKMNMPSIPRGAALRGILKALREKKFVAILADQDAGSNGIFVNFLGRPASTGRGPAAFVLKMAAPLVFCVAIREPSGRHRIEAELLTFDFSRDDASISEEEKLQLATEAWTKVLEKYIRQHPDHWFWMHRRWKTRPVTSNQ